MHDNARAARKMVIRKIQLQAMFEQQKISGQEGSFSITRDDQRLQSTAKESMEVFCLRIARLAE